jgi:hypothetical protein
VIARAEGREPPRNETPVNEAQWLTWTEPEGLAALLIPPRWGQPPLRECRLFACASVRLACRIFGAPCAEELLEVAERYANGDAHMEEVWAAYFAAQKEHNSSGRGFQLTQSAVLPPADAAARLLANPVVWREMLTGPRRGDWARSQCDLLRCLTGRRFQRAPLDSAWSQAQDGLVRRLAQGCYDSRDFTAMPVLGDALEEAGCCDPVVLAHCHQQAEHCRGCFVLDAILGKR